VTTIRNQLLVDPYSAKVFESGEKAYGVKGQYCLSSEEGRKIVARVKGRGPSGMMAGSEELKYIYCFLNLNDGQEDIFNILDLISNVDFRPHSRLQELKVLHAFQIALAMKDQAKFLNKAHGMQMLNSQFSKKEDRLHEAARLFLRSGNFRDYCEVQFELGEYNKAMAFAPAVGIEYWQELAERHTSILRKEKGPT
jgi:hypothetical protein